MEKTKGIVMRTSSKVTVIFTKKGDFLEIPTPKEPPVVGQTIEVDLNPKRLSVLHNSALKYAATAAVLLLVLSISVFSLLFIPNMAVASVALDINKGIELLINKEGKVIKVQDVNGGSGIMEGISIKGLDVYQAVDLIVENANNQGTLNETQNLVLASVVPINKWGTQIVDTEKLRNSIRDEMTRRNLSGSVVVGQTNQKNQQEAKQQGMTVNSYLIYDRCEEKGIAVQPDTLRNNAQKALVDANVSVATLFPEESFEVRAENEHPSNMESNTTENHDYMNRSENQNWSSGSNPSNWSAPKSSSSPPVNQPSQGTSPNWSKPSSDQVSPDNKIPESSTPQQPMNPSYNEDRDYLNPDEEEHNYYNNQNQSDWPQNSGEHSTWDRNDSW
ncbi:MAG: anti-sigma factor domain-containing protein [Desulfosporosinus sp.]|nr:anti-sigma factor domain-containing protein [Desulfosporosinus sp.]